ncbi:hypothetical protein JF714_15565 [Mycobacterium avium]|uniref:hypothetical protein n=1 Tax=Mycobacterium avium TaxID=1764 RepID=UPI001CDA7349|nr:hypothetical protein [Mycobacterium avium]MCA2331860.1 hypothetical protein [Mycobacterium avium]
MRDWFALARKSWEARNSDPDWFSKRVRSFNERQFEDAIRPMVEQQFLAGVRYGYAMAKQITLTEAHRELFNEEPEVMDEEV